MRPSCGVEISPKIRSCLRVQMSYKVGELIFVTQFLNTIMYFALTYMSLLKRPCYIEVLRDEYSSDVPLITALGEELAHIPPISRFQQIVKHEQKAVTSLLKIGGILIRRSGVSHRLVASVGRQNLR